MSDGLVEISKAFNPFRRAASSAGGRAGKRAGAAAQGGGAPKMTDWVQRDPFGVPVVSQPYKVPQQKMVVTQPREKYASIQDTVRELGGTSKRRRSSRFAAGGDSYWNSYGGS